MIEGVRAVTWFGLVGLRVIRGVSGLGPGFLTSVHGHPGHRSTITVRGRPQPMVSSRGGRD